MNKVIGAGLNKTGTKTLRYHLEGWGFRHRSHDLEAFRRFLRGEVDGLLDEMEDHDSFEDWPWPLLYREIDERFPGSKFILTTRESPEIWYRSLCKMAVRMGPLDDYEKYVYGYAMPQGHRDEMIRFYLGHNSEVRRYFSDRPDQFLELCWETGQGVSQLNDFLGVNEPMEPEVHINRSTDVYGGDSLVLATLNRWGFQTYWKLKRSAARAIKRYG